jgi:hypothetical protein
VTEQPEPAAPPVVLGPPAPKHESPLERAEGWLRGHGPQIEADAITVADELKPLLRGHAAGVLELASRVLADPALKSLAPDVLELAVSAVTMAGVAL